MTIFIRSLLLLVALAVWPNYPAQASYTPASVMDFCTPGSLSTSYGGADNTVCVQNAVNFICNRTPKGGTLYFPPGLYQVQKLLVPCAGVTLQGEGWGGRDAPYQQGTFIVGLTSFSGAPVIQFKVTTPATPPFSLGAGVKNMWVVTNYGQGSRSDPLIELDNVSGALIENVAFFAPCTAVRMYGGFRNKVANSESFQQPISNCEVMQMVGDTANNLDVAIFENVKMDAGTNSACFAMHGFVHTAWISRAACETSGKALVVNCPSPLPRLSCPGFITLYDFEAEAFGNIGGNLIEITDLIDGFKMTDSWIRGGDQTNVRNILLSIAPGRFSANDNFPVTVANSWFKYGGGDCINVSGSGVIITGNTLYGCNLYNGGRAGVWVASSKTSVTGNTFCGDDAVATITWPMSAIVIAPGSDYVSITGNIFSSSVGGRNNGCTNGVVNLSGASHISTVGNVGP